MSGPRADRLVVLPMKDPSLAKNRLRGALTDAGRRALACGLFMQMLELLVRLRRENDVGRFDIAVVTASARIRALAVRAGVRVIAEGAPRSLSQAVEKAARWAVRIGYGSLCILPSDLAAPAPEELRRLLQAPTDRNRAVLVPAADLGTNALMLSPPNAFRFAYGKRSFVKHFRAAEQAGLNPIMLPLASLRHDVDTQADLARAGGYALKAAARGHVR